MKCRNQADIFLIFQEEKQALEKALSRYKLVQYNSTKCGILSPTSWILSLQQPVLYGESSLDLNLFNSHVIKSTNMLSQLQSQKLQHKILPHHIALLNLLHLDCISLEQRIEDEMNDNPALEETDRGEELGSEKFSKETVQDFQNWDEYVYDDIPDYKTEYKNYISTEKMPDKQLEEVVDFRTDLKKQFRFNESCEDKYPVADFLIDSLNEDGFLCQDIETIAEEISFKNNTWVLPEQLRDVLDKIRELDPLGVGSCDIQEYFLIQLKTMKGTQRVEDAIVLLENHYSDLRGGNIEKIRKDMNMKNGELKDVLELLSELKTKPITAIESSFRQNNVIFPDFIVSTEGDEPQVMLSRQRSASLHISQSWLDMVQSMDHDKAADKNARQYARSKLASAQWFIKAIHERESNMLKVMKAIVHYQLEYFRYGDMMLLKPMVLRNIAEIVGLDISTVSRITCNKYADTHFGIIWLKDLFTEGLANQEGDMISNKVIQTMVEEVVKNEDKKNPYTDQQLADILCRKGYKIARRTIAKYRDQLNIPVAQLRAVLF
jgi:RNA polymerase sigma-54 factor